MIVIVINNKHIMHVLLSQFTCFWNEISAARQSRKRKKKEVRAKLRLGEFRGGLACGATLYFRNFGLNMSCTSIHMFKLCILILDGVVQNEFRAPKSGSSKFHSFCA